MPIIHSLYRESGTVRIDRDTCNRCGNCAKICPADVLTMENGEVRIEKSTAFGCIACGHCMMACPEEGVITVTGRGISPDDLAPMPEQEQKASADGLGALMQARRSFRRFKRRDVEADTLQRIVEMAATGPMGIPPWDIGCVIVSGPEEVQRLANDVVQGYQGFLKLFRPWLLTLLRPVFGKAKYEMFAHFVRPLAETYVQGHRQGRDLLFYEAPALLIFHHSPYAEASDAMIACTYAMLAAESLGLGSTMIGGAAPIIQRNKTLCRKLGVPDGNTPCISLILGYPAAHFKHTIRRRFSSVSNV